MIAKYYVAIKTQTNEHHAVHKEDCPFLPDDGKTIYLGEFNSGEDAVMEGKRHFIRSNGCLFCSKDHQPERREPVLSERDYKGSFPTKSQISKSVRGNLFYYLN